MNDRAKNVIVIVRELFSGLHTYEEICRAGTLEYLEMRSWLSAWCRENLMFYIYTTLYSLQN